MEGTDLNLRQFGQSLEATDLNLKPAGQIQKESGLNLKQQTKYRRNRFESGRVGTKSGRL